MSQYPTPLVIAPDKGPATKLTRISFAATTDAGRYDEKWLQSILFANPEALPTGEVDPAYGQVVPVCRELQTPAGPIDLVYATPDGGLVLVETKLWRNPEARRAVVAQILDYAKELARWDYEDMSREVAKATKGRVNSLFAVVQAVQPALDEARFIDGVSRNLKNGRFLLMIAGDGIREGVENLTDFLDRLGRLEFTFGLVELALYQFGGGNVLIQPRVLARTMILKRTVIRVEEGSSGVKVEEEGEVQEREESSDPRSSFYTGFWTPFLSSLRLDDASQPMAQANRSPNIYFSLPPSGSQAWVSAYFAQSQKQVGVYLRLARGSFGEEAYKRLLQEKDQIDTELGAGAEWYERDGKYSVASRTRYSSLDDPAELDRIRKYFAERLNKYISTFRPRMERIAGNI